MTRPDYRGYGRLNVPDGAAPPIIFDCRWCGGELNVRAARLLTGGSIVYCPTCDPHITPRKATP